MYRPDPRYLTSAQAAAQLGISRRTLYRWMHEGRIDALLTPETIANVHKRPRGPKRNPRRKPAGRTYSLRWCSQRGYEARWLPRLDVDRGA
jgi:hypothetical protein